MTFTEWLGVYLLVVVFVWFIWACLAEGLTPRQYFLFEDDLDDEDWASGDGGCFIEERTR